MFEQQVTSKIGMAWQMAKRGMDVEVRGKDGWTPLLVAAAAGNVKAGEELLSAKANINSLGDNGETALIVACASGKKEMAQVPTPLRLRYITHASERSTIAYVMFSPFPPHILYICIYTRINTCTHKKAHICHIRVYVSTCMQNNLDSIHMAGCVRY
jgi:hypothetical protein